MRYALEGGGKRVRPVICLATAEAAGGDRRARRCRRRSRSSWCTRSRSSTTTCPRWTTTTSAAAGPRTHRAFPEGVALLAGDALMTEAMLLALTYDTPEVARELARATQGMIGGQYLDITGAHDDLAELHRLKTGRLFAASVGHGALGGGRAGRGAGAVARLRRGARAALPGRRRRARRRRLRGRARRRRGARPGARGRGIARGRGSAEVPADTSVLRGIVDDLAVRTV